MYRYVVQVYQTQLCRRTSSAILSVIYVSRKMGYEISYLGVGICHIEGQESTLVETPSTRHMGKGMTMEKYPT
jgi:hypothetical protein